MITATLLRAIAPRANPKLVGELAASMAEILPAARISQRHCGLRIFSPRPRMKAMASGRCRILGADSGAECL